MRYSPFSSKAPLAFAAALMLGIGAVGCSKTEDSSSGTSSTTAGASTPAGSTPPGTGKPHTQATAEEIERYQGMLDAVGCWAGAVDGKLGPQTEVAIKEFQAAEKLTVDGLLGPVTEAKLTDAAARGGKVCAASGTTTSKAGGSTTTKAGGSTTSSAGGSTSTTAAGSTTTRA